MLEERSYPKTLVESSKKERLVVDRMSSHILPEGKNVVGNSSQASFMDNQENTAGRCLDGGSKHTKKSESLMQTTSQLNRCIVPKRIIHKGALEKIDMQ